VVAEVISPKVVRWVAGLGFIAVGLWVLVTSESPVA
jgi:putative Ca2+/H+ antiporter (TMEM165/GDT1 family)